MVLSLSLINNKSLMQPVRHHVKGPYLLLLPELPPHWPAYCFLNPPDTWLHVVSLCLTLLSSCNIYSINMSFMKTILIIRLKLLMIFLTICYAMLCYAKSLQSCPTLCDPIDGSLPGSPVPGILQARTLEWVAISFSNAWKWRVKVKSFSRVRLLATRPWDFPGKSTGVGCRCLLYTICYF